VQFSYFSYVSYFSCIEHHRHVVRESFGDESVAQLIDGNLAEGVICSEHIIFCVVAVYRDDFDDDVVAHGVPYPPSPSAMPAVTSPRQRGTRFALSARRAARNATRSLIFLFWVVLVCFGLFCFLVCFVFWFVLFCNVRLDKKETKEQKNKRTKEQKNKRTKEQKNKRTKEQKNKRTK